MAKDDFYVITEEFRNDKGLMFLAENLAMIYDNSHLLSKELGYTLLAKLIKDAKTDEEMGLVRDTLKATIIILAGQKKNGVYLRDIKKFEKKTNMFWISFPLLANYFEGNFEIVMKDGEFGWKITEKGQKDIFGILKDLHEGKDSTESKNGGI